LPRLSLIAALTTDGEVYFSLTHAMTNADVMLLFMANLVRKLDGELLFWKEETVFLLDGAKYHVSNETQTYLKKLNIEVIYSGPYSYLTAPIELLFGGMKKG